nr:hypothetical protein [Tanacetum cinerariifolium]
MDYMHTTKAELEIDFNKPLSEQYPILKLNDLARKKRKYDDDIHDYFRSTKKFKSLVRYEDHLTRTMLNEPILESVTRILNMVPTKKGYKALVEQDTLDKLQQRSVKCIFIGYPKETMDYYFYFSLENKIVVARYAEFLKKNLISQGVSGRAGELKEIKDKDTSPSENTSKIPAEVEGFEPPQKEEAHVRRVDYEEMFLRVADIRAIRILIAIAALYDYEIWQMDVKTAFLNGYLDEDIYMVQHEGFVDPKYPNKSSGSNVTFLILYVDDIIVMGNHISMLQSVKSYLGKCFAMKDLEEATFILGIKICRDRTKRLIRLSQSAYVDKILKRSTMDNSKHGNISMQEIFDLNKTQGASTPEEVKRKQNVPYASAVGSIMYAVRCTRPDVEFTQNITSRFQQSPREPHWTARKPFLKVEYIAASEAAMETVWIMKFVSGLGLIPTINESIKMLCDNSAALLIANEPGVQRGPRHYHRRYHYVRECIELGEINLLKVHTDNNLADPFTKALPKGNLTQHARSM